LKKACALVLLAAFLFLVGSDALAQDKASYYYVNLNLLKVYPTSLGYKVLYRTRSIELHEAYIPNEWFAVTISSEGVPSASKADVIYDRGTDLPYMTVFYKDAKFSHVRLFLPTWRGDPSYGRLEMSTDLVDKFKVEELKIVL
jgi:hypothetical protein